MTMEEQKTINSKIPRKAFLRFAGAGAAALSMLAIACKKTSGTSNDPNDVGSGDVGILNYVYALEQLEAAFYTQVILTPYTGITVAETSLLTDIRDHEIAHRELFKAYLNTAASPTTSLDVKSEPASTITTNFTSIDFTNRTAVLTAAKTFEDINVAAYNGIAYLFQSSTYLAQIAKIVSVEGRHSAVVRNLLSPGTFADNTAVDTNGLDKALLPSQVLTAVSAYISSPITAKLLP